MGLRIQGLNHVQEQIKNLFYQSFARPLRILEVDIVKYIIFRGDSYAIFLTFFFVSYIVVSCMLFKIFDYNYHIVCRVLGLVPVLLDSV